MGAEATTPDRLEFCQAFREHEHQVRARTGKLACALVVLLMPLGALVDAAVYSGKLPLFLALRCTCSILVGGIWLLHYTSLARRFYPAIGMPIVLLPAFSIALIMALSGQGAGSSYYASLNLILLAVSAVGHWSMAETLVAAGSVLLMYLGLYPFTPKAELNEHFFTNCYFIVLTGIIVTCGNYIFNQLRLSEFQAKYQLDKSRKELEETNHKLRELDQIKSRFFANISHELRTPLTLLLAPLEMLLHRFKLDTETRNTLSTMHANGMRLLKLINDLLDLVRLESGRMQVKSEPVGMREFLGSLASAARQVADDKKLSLQTVVAPDLGVVMIDRDKFEKVVLNLVFNALKFTPAGGRVEMRAEKSGDYVTLEVADTGAGISEKNLPFVFDRFWQADGSARRKYQGVGIGLALVKELVEVQGGSVTVQSCEGKGTTFTVRLPYKAADAESLIAATAPAEPAPVPTAADDGGTISSEEWVLNLHRRAELFPALTPVQEALKTVEGSGNGTLPTILVADDEPDMLRFLKSQLSARFHVLEAVDGAQAVEKASQFLPELIVLDMMMPEKDGLQACREIRENTPTRSIPVIMLTARADEQTKLAALSAGASDFLPKPFSTTELNVRIKNLVDSHRSQRNLNRQKQQLESTVEQLKDTEVELVRVSRMSSLGVLAAGIIHDINNFLNPLITNHFVLQKKSEQLPPEDRGEYLQALNESNDGIQAIKNLANELRKFAHPGSGRAEIVDVAEVIQAALMFTRHELKKHDITLVENVVPGQTIWANRNSLVQVLMNLILNSRDALSKKLFPDGERPTLWIEGRTEKGRSLLTVRDNGTGIKAEHLDKIYDPYFTTKDVGEGTGLGLSICYRVVQESDGQITARTELGKFCEFTLAFPSKG